MQRPLRPCIACGRLSRKSRCPRCTTRPKTAEKMGAGWARISAEQIKRQPFCVRCGTTEDLTADHIRPRAHGGTNEPENLQTLCRRCNSRKGHRGS